MEMFGNIQYEFQFEPQKLVVWSHDGLLFVFSVKISLAEHKRICKRNKELNVAHVVWEEDLLVEDIDDELDMVELRPLISIPQRRGVEKIVNLAEWMKSPWALKSDWNILPLVWSVYTQQIAALSRYFDGSTLRNKYENQNYNN